MMMLDLFMNSSWKLDFFLSFLLASLYVFNHIEVQTPYSITESWEIDAFEFLLYIF
jgi:hypothetical protein